jgi:hypothetical protein
VAVAHKTGALTTRDLERVVVDTTVQPKAIAHPTDARLCHRALEKLVDLAKRNNVPLRQSYARLTKRVAIIVGRYTHAKGYRGHNHQHKFRVWITGQVRLVLHGRRFSRVPRRPFDGVDEVNIDAVEDLPAEPPNCSYSGLGVTDDADECRHNSPIAFPKAPRGQ